MKIFVSHISEEAGLAQWLKTWIESTFSGQCEVFVSSDSNDLSLGDKWIDTIEAKLSDTKLLIVLCSPRSLLRPWINFEAGCGWIKRIPIIPICHSGQDKDKLPPPLFLFQALDLESDESCEALIQALADKLDINKLPRINYDEMKRELATALDGVQSRPLPNSRSLEEMSPPELRSRIRDLEELYVRKNAEALIEDAWRIEGAIRTWAKTSTLKGGRRPTESLAKVTFDKIGFRNISGIYKSGNGEFELRTSLDPHCRMPIIPSGSVPIIYIHGTNIKTGNHVCVAIAGTTDNDIGLYRCYGS